MQSTSSPVIDRPTAACPPHQRPPAVRCADLAGAVGQLGPDDDLFAGSLLSSAVNECAVRAGRSWTFDPAPPPALLLRALATLAIHAPDARSTGARVLLDAHLASLRDAS